MDILKTIDGTPAKCGFESNLWENNVHVTSSTWLLLEKKMMFFKTGSGIKHFFEQMMSFSLHLSCLKKKNSPSISTVLWYFHMCLLLYLESHTVPSASLSLSGSLSLDHMWGEERKKMWRLQTFYFGLFLNTKATICHLVLDFGFNCS